MPDVPCSQGVVPRDSVPAVQWRAAGGKGAQDDEVSAAALVVSHVWILQFAYAVAAAITSLHVPIFGSTLWACRDGVYVDLGFFQDILIAPGDMPEPSYWKEDDKVMARPMRGTDVVHCQQHTRRWSVTTSW
jgi:hypothetical protein